MFYMYHVSIFLGLELLKNWRKETLTIKGTWVPRKSYYVVLVRHICYVLHTWSWRWIFYCNTWVKLSAAPQIFNNIYCNLSMMSLFKEFQVTSGLYKIADWTFSMFDSIDTFDIWLTSLLSLAYFQVLVCQRPYLPSHRWRQSKSSS